MTPPAGPCFPTDALLAPVVGESVATAGLAWLPWRQALAVAAVLLVTGLVLRRLQRAPKAAFMTTQIGIVLALYGAWQFSGRLTHRQPSHAITAGMDIARWQEALHLPSEASLQSLVIHHPFLIATADWYYASLHVPVFVAVLIWVLVRHPQDWAFTRNTTALLTGMCLLIQLHAVAPPRLLPQLGVIDTATANGRSVYALITDANQFSAMPSIHMAWASAAALFVIVSARTPWRWVALTYPLATLTVIVVTGNHFILDGIVALLLLAVAAAISYWFAARSDGRSPRVSYSQSITSEAAM